MEPMQLEINTEAWLFLVSLLVGAGMGTVYEFLRALRAVFKHNRAWYFAEDLIYSLTFGTVFFIFSTWKANAVRGFVLVGMIAGVIASTVSSGIVVRAALARLFMAVKKCVVVPLVSLFRWANAKRKQNIKKDLKFIEDEKKSEKALASKI